MTAPESDADYAARFDRGEVRPEDFHHREHLRLAWACLQAEHTDPACDRMCAAIQAFAQRAGKPGKFHLTLTQFWVRLLAGVRRSHGATAELADVLPAHPELLDSATPLAYYSADRLWSDAARLAWQAPDLRPLPPTP
ncbi:MAG: hypothetical protein HY021_13990 [Burkholderiales bacterium]|nr:hypothetical protein [Burkholderiales bacterium]